MLICKKLPPGKIWIILTDGCNDGYHKISITFLMFLSGDFEVNEAQWEHVNGADVKHVRIATVVIIIWGLDCAASFQHASSSAITTGHWHNQWSTSDFGTQHSVVRLSRSDVQITNWLYCGKTIWDWEFVTSVGESYFKRWSITTLNYCPQKVSNRCS